MILIKYGELTTKKDNRKYFTLVLENNIKDKLINIDYKIIRTRDRMFIESNDEEQVVNILTKIFGIHSIVICDKVNTSKDEIIDKCLNIARCTNFKSFKVVTKRSDKSFAIRSMDFNQLVAGAILKNVNNIKVDVHNPEFLLRIEIRRDYTYIYNKEVKGLGGYPVGVAGKGLLMLSGGIDSPVAGYLALKRGIKLEAIYFEAIPHTSLQARNKVKTLLEKLEVYGTKIKLHIVNFTDIQEAIYKNCEPSYMITIMRRMMYRIATTTAINNKCKIIINGESVGQVASQTLSSMYVINNVTNYPIIRPVCCLDKLEIIEISKKIDTYNTSILPYEDCCTVFVPRHPVINPKLDKAKEEEIKFDYQLLINKTIENVFVDKKNNDFESLI